MISSTFLPIRHSTSLSSMCDSRGNNDRVGGVFHSQSMGNLHGKTGASSIFMGPVVAAVVMFAIERFVIRLMTGQLLRKGVPRKIRRLGKMMTQVSVISAVAHDVLDDIPL